MNFQKFIGIIFSAPLAFLFKFGDFCDKSFNQGLEFWMNGRSKKS